MRRTTLAATLTAVIALAPAMAASAQDPPAGQPDLSGYIIDLQRPVLDLQMWIEDLQLSIEDLQAGTTTISEPEQIEIRLDANVFFDFDKTELKPAAREVLRDVATQVRGDDARELLVVGHTDAKGTEEYNLDLSRRRAQAVADALRTDLGGVSITTDWKGETEPIAPNEREDGSDNPEGRAFNRRVELTYRPAD